MNRSRASDMGRGGQDETELHKPNAAPALQMRDLSSYLRHFRKARIRLENHAGAICRRYCCDCRAIPCTCGSKTRGASLLKAARKSEAAALPVLPVVGPLLESAEIIGREERSVAKEMEKLVAQLPCAPWVEATRGVGAFGIAQVVGFLGDLGNYATAAKVWKAMSVGILPDGRAQRRVAGEAALEMKWSPERRALVHCLADAAMKAQGPLRELYLERKALEITKGCSKLHAHRRALRNVGKKILRDLWAAWRT